MHMWLLFFNTPHLLSVYTRVVMAGLAKDEEDGEAYPVYVGRYEHGQVYTPARVVGASGEQGLELVEAQVPVNGSVLVVRENIEVLVLLEDSEAAWERLDSAVDIPNLALPVGETNTGEEIYFGRIQNFPFTGTTCVGKIHPSQRRFLYPHKDGDERFLDIVELGGSLEILTVIDKAVQSQDNYTCFDNHSTISIKHKL